MITGEAAADRRHVERQLSGNRTRGKAPAMSGRGRDVFSSNSLWWAFFHFRRTGWITPVTGPVKGAYAAGRRDDIKELGARLYYPGGSPGSSWPYGLWGSVPVVKSGLGSLR